MATKRTYMVGSSTGVRLVKATTRQQALSHVAHTVFTVQIPTQDELVKHVLAGVSVEHYSDAEQMEIV